MSFIVVIILPILDIAYTVANMQVCSAFPPNSQALAGSIFSVATRVGFRRHNVTPGYSLIFDSQLGTSIGLSVLSTVANSVSLRFNKTHPDCSPTDPSVLMAGFRAAGWTCSAAMTLALIIAIGGMRGVGLVGQKRTTESIKTSNSDLEMTVHSTVASIQPASESNSLNPPDGLIHDDIEVVVTLDAKTGGKMVQA